MRWWRVEYDRAARVGRLALDNRERRFGREKERHTRIVVPDADINAARRARSKRSESTVSQMASRDASSHLRQCRVDHTRDVSRGLRCVAWPTDARAACSLIAFQLDGLQAILEIHTHRLIILVPSPSTRDRLVHVAQDRHNLMIHGLQLYVLLELIYFTRMRKQRALQRTILLFHALVASADPQVLPCSPLGCSGVCQIVYYFGQ